MKLGRQEKKIKTRAFFDRGETASSVTKIFRLGLQKFYNIERIIRSSSSSSSSTCSNLMGNRIDIRVIDENDTELAFYEMKAGNQGTIALQQESKAMRINMCLDIVNRQGGTVTGVKPMNWCGYTGAMYDLIQYKGVTVATNQVNLLYPQDYQEFQGDAFKNTVLAMFENRAHVLHYSQSIHSSKIIPKKMPQVFLDPKKTEL
jgi:hypothetical protein